LIILSHELAVAVDLEEGAVEEILLTCSASFKALDAAASTISALGLPSPGVVDHVLQKMETKARLVPAALGHTAIRDLSITLMTELADYLTRLDDPAMIVGVWQVALTEIERVSAALETEGIETPTVVQTMLRKFGRD
jgi:hypothetical protein